jgi:hypothetical protein
MSMIKRPYMWPRSVVSQYAGRRAGSTAKRIATTHPLCLSSTVRRHEWWSEMVASITPEVQQDDVLESVGT